MWRHPILKVLALAYVVWGGWQWYSHRPLNTAQGILAKDDPIQVDIADGASIQVKRWTLTIRARYEITARVLSRTQYHFDSLADLVPEDLALGWGPMSDSRTLKSIDISQSNRFYYWHTDGEPPIPAQSIVAHSANTHVIPRNPLVARLLARLRPGQVVTLKGELVDGARSDGAWIRTSMARTDTGPGACELMLVEDVTLP